MKKGLLFITILLFHINLHGQCPDKHFLWQRIVYLRDSSKIAPDKQLTELLSYEKEMFNCSYRNDSTHAFLLQRIGWLFKTTDDFENAILYSKRSIKMVDDQENKDLMNPLLAIKTYWNLFHIYNSLNWEQQKIDACKNCILRTDKVPEGYIYALAAIKILAPFYLYKGDYFRCLEYSELGEKIVKNTSRTPIENEYNSIQFVTWKINALIFLKRSNEAGQEVLTKIRFAEEHESNYLLGTLYGLYAKVLSDEGKYKISAQYLRKSLKFNLLFGYDQACAAALNNLGYLYFLKLNDHDEALKYYFRALDYGDNIERLNIYGNIANIYTASANFDSSFFYFQKAFNQLGTGYTESDLLKDYNNLVDNEITEYITGLLIDKGAAYFKKYKTTGSVQAINKAIQIYETTDNYFNKVKESQADIQSKLFWKSNNRRLYERAIEACFETQNHEKAFYFFEKSRAVLLNDQINEKRWMADIEIAKLASLNKDIIQLKNKLNTLPEDSNEYLEFQKTLVIRNQELDGLANGIKSKNPLYYKNHLDTSFIKIDQLKKDILGNSKTLMEIFSGDSAVYVLMITNNKQSLVKINKALYDSLINSFNEFIENGEKLNRHFKEFVNVSNNLYQLLFKNLVPPAGSMIISPDGNNFPFEALLLNGDSNKPDYFLHHYAVSYTYSVKYLTNWFGSKKNNQNNILGIAPVQYSKYENLSPLTGSDYSLQKINQYFTSSTTYLSKEASRSNFLNDFPSYNIIQLYTHASGITENDDPVIYFEDSVLYLTGLLPDRNPITQLVVLSACETALGKWHKGEGIFSFNRGFAALGIPAVISTLWSVENQSTYRITELFYKYLSKGLPTDVALQKAKIEFIDTSPTVEKTLPYFWAGPVLTGKVDILIPKKPLPYWVIIIGIVLFIPMILSVRNTVIKKRTK